MTAEFCPSIQQFFLQINQKLNEDAHPATSRKNPSAPSIQSVTQKHDERGPLSPPPIVQPLLVVLISFGGSLIGSSPKKTLSLRTLSKQKITQPSPLVQLYKLQGIRSCLLYIKASKPCPRPECCVQKGKTVQNCCNPVAQNLRQETLILNSLLLLLFPSSPANQVLILLLQYIRSFSCILMNKILLLQSKQ